jgi:hypothetical protein
MLHEVQGEWQYRVQGSGVRVHGSGVRTLRLDRGRFA